MFLSGIDHNIKKAIPFKMVVIFVLFTLGIVIIGFYYYIDQRKMIFIDHENDLATIASTKLVQIGQ